MILRLISLFIYFATAFADPIDPKDAHPRDALFPKLSEFRWKFAPAPPEDGSLPDCEQPSLNLMTMKALPDQYIPPYAQTIPPKVIAVGVDRWLKVEGRTYHKIDFLPCLPYVLTINFSFEFVPR